MLGSSSVSPTHKLLYRPFPWKCNLPACSGPGDNCPFPEIRAVLAPTPAVNQPYPLQLDGSAVAGPSHQTGAVAPSPQPPTKFKFILAITSCLVSLGNQTDSGRGPLQWWPASLWPFLPPSSLPRLAALLWPQQWGWHPQLSILPFS